MLFGKLHMIIQEMEETLPNGTPHFNLSFDIIAFRHKILTSLSQQLAAYEAQFPLQSLEEQIEYFKELKPALTKYAFYYEKVYNFELREPPLKEQYYARALEQHESTFYENQDLFVYVRSKDNSMDNELFHSQSEKRDLVSMVICNQMITEYLYVKTGKALIPIDFSVSAVPSGGMVKWDFSQNDIVEMAKGFKGIGAANGTIQNIAGELGRFFGTEVNNVHLKSHVIAHRQNVALLFDRCSKFLKDSLRR